MNNCYVPPVVTKPKRKYPLESKVEAEFKKQVRKLGGEAFKFSSPNNRGVFDQIAMFPNGQLVFVEIKAEKGLPSNPQAIFAGKLEMQQQIWCYVYGMSGVSEFIADVENGNGIKQLYNPPTLRKPKPHIKIKGADYG